MNPSILPLWLYSTQHYWIPGNPDNRNMENIIVQENIFFSPGHTRAGTGPHTEPRKAANFFSEFLWTKSSEFQTFKIILMAINDFLKETWSKACLLIGKSLLILRFKSKVHSPIFKISFHIVLHREDLYLEAVLPPHRRCQVRCPLCFKLFKLCQSEVSC